MKYAHQTFIRSLIRDPVSLLEMVH